jgi:hypothetical protein
VKRLLALAALLLAALPGAAGSAGTDPLVGTWRFGDGSIRVVRHANGSFTGTVLSPLRFAACPHPGGEAMWRLFGEDGHYSGRHLSFGPRAGCSLRVHLAASIRVSGRSLELRVARREGIRPGACGALTDCFRLTRVGAAPPRAPEPATPPAVSTAFDLSANGAPESGAPGAEDYSASTAAGRILLSGPGAASGSFLVFDTYADRSELIAVRVERLLSRSAGRVAVAVEVSRATRPGCEAGAAGRLEARDGSDRIALTVCGFARAWTASAAVAVRSVATPSP